LTANLGLTNVLLNGILAPNKVLRISSRTSAGLTAGSKCSVILHKLRFIACFCLARATTPTFFRGTLNNFYSEYIIEKINAL